MQDHDESTGKEEDVRIQEDNEEEDVRIQEDDEEEDVKSHTIEEEDYSTLGRLPPPF
jgi:hypothetical protein